MSDSSISEYMKIRRYMMNVIYRANGQSVQVPTILELSRKFGVSRPTVSKAMKALTEEGYIIGKRGIGSFTNPNFIRTSGWSCRVRWRRMFRWSGFCRGMEWGFITVLIRVVCWGRF